MTIWSFGFVNIFTSQNNSSYVKPTNNFELHVHIFVLQVYDSVAILCISKYVLNLSTFFYLKV